MHLTRARPWLATLLPFLVVACGSAIEPVDESAETTGEREKADVYTKLVLVTPDQPGYQPDDPIAIKIENRFKWTAVYLPGCNPTTLQRQEGTAWKDLQPERTCLWEGTARKLAAGGSLVDPLQPKAPGTYRARVALKTFCPTGKPYSQCNRPEKLVHSAAFTVAGPACGATPASCTVLTPLALDPLAAPAIAAAVQAFDSGCGTGGTWCHLDPPRVFAIPECVTSSPTLQTVVELALAENREAAGLLSWGTVLDRAALGQSRFFSTTYSPGGPALLAAIDAFAADQAVEGWELAYEVPCHNCTDHVLFTVLYYPCARRVVVLEGGYGYDS